MDADFGMAADFRKATYFLDFLYLLIFVSGAVLPPWEGWHPRALRCFSSPMVVGSGTPRQGPLKAPFFDVRAFVFEALLRSLLMTAYFQPLVSPPILFVDCTRQTLKMP